MSVAFDLENFAAAESALSKRLGVRIQLVRSEATHEIGVTARYHAQKTLYVGEGLLDTREVMEALIDTADAAKLALCSHVQEELMNLVDDRDEMRKIVEAAHLYRNKLAELQYAQEAWLKTPKDTAIRAAAEETMTRLRLEAADARHKMTALAAGNYSEGMTL